MQTEKKCENGSHDGKGMNDDQFQVAQNDFIFGSNIRHRPHKHIFVSQKNLSQW